MDNYHNGFESDVIGKADGVNIYNLGVDKVDGVDDNHGFKIHDGISNHGEKYFNIV